MKKKTGKQILLSSLKKKKKKRVGGTHPEQNYQSKKEPLFFCSLGWIYKAQSNEKVQKHTDITILND